jgi:hypothetical protein
MLANLVEESCNNPGTGLNITLLGAPANRNGFAQSFGHGASAYYVLTDGAQSEWGIGTVQVGTPNVLVRTTVLSNTARTTARLNFTGACRVYCEVPAERTPYLRANGLLPATLLDTIVNAQVSGFAAAWPATPTDPGASEVAVFAHPVPPRTRIIKGTARICGEVGGSFDAALFPRIYLLNASGNPAFPAVAPAARGKVGQFIDASIPFSFELNTGTVGNSTAWQIRYNVYRNNPVTMLEYYSHVLYVTDGA